MYCLIVYDIKVERVNKARIFLKRYLNWIQNSVFEGEITEALLTELEVGINEIIEKSLDSVIIFTSSNPKWLDKKVIGVEKNEINQIV